MARQKHRTYSNELKRKVVEAYLSEAYSISSIQQKFELQTPGLIYDWLKLYKVQGMSYFSEKGKQMSKKNKHKVISTDKSIDDSRIASLEQENSDLKLLVAYYQKVIERSEKELNIKIEKKLDTK